MAHTIHQQKKLTQRVRRIRGQLEALERGLEEAADCGAVLQQVAAIRGAVNGLMAEILEGHLREHVAPEDADHREQALEEVVKLIRVYLK